MTKSPRPKPLLTRDEPLRSIQESLVTPRSHSCRFDPDANARRAMSGARQAAFARWSGVALRDQVGRVSDCGPSRQRQRAHPDARGHDWTYRFPAIEAAAKSLGVGTAIIDGEAVVLDEQGRPHFGMLQNSLGGRRGKLPSGQAMMMAFDLLYFDGHDIRSMELSFRRFFLESLLRSEEGAIRLSEAVDGDGSEIFAVACEQGLEGIIAKHRDSSYRSGRLGDWIKVKCLQSDSFIVVGYEQSSVARAGIGSLLLAARKGREWVYVGNVGTGFTESNAEALRNTLERIRAKRPPVEYDGRRRNVVWVQPTLIAEIEYRAWTHDRKLRHASFKGLREVQDNAAVYEIE